MGAVSGHCFLTPSFSHTFSYASLVTPTKNGMVVGWGTTTSQPGSTPDALKAVCLPVVKHDVCQKAYTSEGYVITSNMVCAGLSVGGQDSCNGDSGGGYVFLDHQTNKWVLGGVVSWGSAQGCAQPGKYGVYVKVANYIQWIYEKMV